MNHQQRFWQGQDEIITPCPFFSHGGRSQTVEEKGRRFSYELLSVTFGQFDKGSWLSVKHCFVRKDAGTRKTLKEFYKRQLLDVRSFGATVKDWTKVVETFTHTFLTSLSKTYEKVYSTP